MGDALTSSLARKLKPDPFRKRDEVREELGQRGWWPPLQLPLELERPMSHHRVSREVLSQSLECLLSSRHMLAAQRQPDPSRLGHQLHAEVRRGWLLGLQTRLQEPAPPGLKL